MKVLVNLLLAILIVDVIKLVNGARILAIVPLPARSHHRFTQPILKALAKAGHEVVVYSPFPLDEPHPNYTDVLLEHVTFGDISFVNMILDFTKRSYYKCINIYFEAMEMGFNNFIKSENIHQLLKSKQHFDLVLTQAFSGMEFTLILGHIFKAPVIGMKPFSTNSVANSNLGNTLSLPYIPDTCSPFGTRLSFLERFLNSIYIWRGLYYLYYQKYLPAVEDKLKQHFPDTPPILDMINNVPIVFVNDHLTADYARPRTPNIIPVAGIHIEEEQPLPQNIQTFMDEASEGVIYLSLGSCIPDELHPKEYFDMYNRVFGQLKQRVLWKTRKENVEGLPENVMTVGWAPQRDVLAHPNCVLFITHGGLLSQHEAVHFGVPVVVIPQYFDQHRNARFYEEKGVGIRLNLKEMSETTVLAAIRKILDNPQYTNNMKRLSRVFRDQPMTPEQTVVYWTEYVLRHGGASHLKPASTQLSWYQLALLDVLAAILAVIISVITFTYLIYRIVFKNIFNNQNNNTSLKKKRN